MDRREILKNMLHEYNEMNRLMHKKAYSGTYKGVPCSLSDCHAIWDMCCKLEANGVVDTFRDAPMAFFDSIEGLRKVPTVIGAKYYLEG